MSLFCCFSINLLLYLFSHNALLDYPERNSPSLAPDERPTSPMCVQEPFSLSLSLLMKNAVIMVQQSTVCHMVGAGGED